MKKLLLLLSAFAFITSLAIGQKGGPIRGIPTSEKKKEAEEQLSGTNYTEAVRWAKKYQQDMPKDMDAIIYIAQAELMMRDYAEAERFFKELLEKHIRDERQVNDYAKRLGISRISLNAAIKKQFGITATDMIKERLLFEIKTELLYTTKNISEIAFDLHFSEPNNLIRLFKSKTGLSPNAFRKTYQIDSSI